MPFDGPNLQSLVTSLRNLPDDFMWDYRNSLHCAMGLAERLWPKHALNGPNPWSHWGRVLGLSEQGAYDAFCGAGPEKAKLSRDVTPEDVAGILEAQLDGAL